MNRVVIFSLILFASTAEVRATLNALLSRRPAITSATIDPNNADRILIRIDRGACQAALSEDAGETFVPLHENEPASAWSRDLTAGTRRYVFDDGFLLRSDDSGETWSYTGASAFLTDQGQAIAADRERVFFEQYGSRLPPRSPFWHPLFVTFSLGYSLVTIALLRNDGWFVAVLTALRGTFVLLLVWLVLYGFHAMIEHVVAQQYPMDYWSRSTTSVAPTKKLGLAMAIVARPLPLLAYLAVLWPLLPGSMAVLVRILGAPRRWTALTVSVVAGVAFLGFHLLIIFIEGTFWTGYYYA